MFTSCGGLIIPGIVACLRAEVDYVFHIVGVDMDAQAVGAHFVDSFHIVPAGLDPAYPERILELAQQENVDVIVPLSDEECLSLSGHRERFAEKGVRGLCSDVKMIEIASDKGKTLTFLRNKGVPTPEFFCPTSLRMMDEVVESLGYPEREIVLKPTRARGARGFWILSEKRNGQDLIFKERCLQRLPYPIVRSLLAERPDLPPVVVMQYLHGADFNVDVLSWQGETMYCIPIQRIVPDAGPVQVGRIVNDTAIDTMVEKIIAAFGFSYNINVELAYPDKTRNQMPLVYEINARVSAPIAAHRVAGVNLLLYGILLALGREVPKNKPYKNITMHRFWQEIYS